MGTWVLEEKRSVALVILIVIVCLRIEQNARGDKCRGKLGNISSKHTRILPSFQFGTPLI